MKTFIIISVIAFLIWNVLGGICGIVFIKQKYEQLFEELQKEKRELKDKLKRLQDGSLYKWHDLTKNPQDLPKECTTVLAIELEAEELGPITFKYITSDQWEWLPRRIAVLNNKQIRAWCEIPEFVSSSENPNR